MKYLKKFEDIDEPKYYLVLRAKSSDLLFLLSIYDESDQKFICKILYSFDEDAGLVKKNYDDNTTLPYNFVKELELYKNDNLEECIKFMETYFDTEKYNL